jgi:uncharacterized membrane protein YcaP (DUF421 family)
MFGEPQFLLQLAARVIDPGTAAILIAMIVATVAIIGHWLTHGERPAVLIEDGNVDGDVLRRFGISDDDVQRALRRQGLRSFAEVRRGYVDGGGEILLIRQRALPA